MNCNSKLKDISYTPKKILIVDDSEENREFLVDMLQNFGKHECLIACNGLEAYELYKSNLDIDLLITDVNMPLMCGKTLIKKIRQNETSEKIKIIMMSGREIEEDFVKQNCVCLKLEKPFGFVDLVEKIENIFVNSNCKNETNCKNK